MRASMSGPDLPVAFATLEPRALWSVFFEICAIPHASHNEEALALWSLDRALRGGLHATRDAAGNVVIRKPAREGREEAPGVILQAHLDMVPQKDATVSHDFSRDPIRPRLDPDDAGWLRATGTTLGADDGIGVAAGFALLEDADLDHGPLELLLTVNEEDGMTGVQALDPGLLSGHYLLNLDGEDEDELCVGSAGSQRLYFTFDNEAEKAPAGFSWLEVSVAGLLGGHSGCDIQLGRANALRLLVGLLRAETEVALRLSSSRGGSLPNAIPREARALVGMPAGDRAAFQSGIEMASLRAKAAFGTADPGLAIGLSQAEAPDRALSPTASKRVLGALAEMPDGLRSMLEGIPGVARLSSNFGAVDTRTGEAAGGGEKIVITGKILARGAFDAEKAELAARIGSTLEGGGAVIEWRSLTPAWSPDLGSPLLAIAREVWGEAAKAAARPEVAVQATHGGLECNLFRLAFPDWDMLSIGPTVRFPHSPDEAVDIASVERFFAKARRLIERLAR